MSSRDQMTAVARTQEASKTAFAVEAHYYSGGLRERLLGTQGGRPDWIPPAKYVGFKNELALANGDHVVEFARFLVDSRKVTWVGTFKRAVDAVYGDRQNHSGVGVWLLGHDVVHAQALLTSLRVFADTDPQDPSLDADAERFLGEYLSGYLQPSPDHPAALSGWPFAASRFTETAIYMASDEDDAAAWGMAADQVLRATLLPPPSPAHSRALILVRPGKAEPEQGWSPLERGTLVGELARALPRAFESAQDEVRAAMAQVQAAIELGRLREAELAQAAESRARLEQQVADLTQQADRLRSDLQASDPDRERARLHEAVRDLSQQVTGLKTALNATRSDLLTEIGNIRRRSDGQQRGGGAEPFNPPGRRPSGDTRKDRSRKWLIIAAIVALFVVAAALIIALWPRSSPAPLPPADPVIEYGPDPSATRP